MIHRDDGLQHPRTLTGSAICLTPKLTLASGATALGSVVLTRPPHFRLSHYLADI
jgi:hypothetical protein